MNRTFVNETEQIHISGADYTPDKTSIEDQNLKQFYAHLDTINQ